MGFLVDNKWTWHFMVMHPYIWSVRLIHCSSTAYSTIPPRDSNLYAYRISLNEDIDIRFHLTRIRFLERTSL